MGIGLLILIVFVFIGALNYWHNNNKWLLLDADWSKTIKFTHLFALFICLIALILCLQFDLFFYGIWTTKFFIFLTLSTGFIIGIFGSIKADYAIESVYFRISSYFYVFISLFICLPFLYMYFPNYALHTIHHEDKIIRIQSSCRSIFEPDYLEIYQKKGLLEKRVSQWLFRGFRVDSTAVSYDKDSTRVTLFYYQNTDTLNLVLDKLD